MLWSKHPLKIRLKFTQTEASFIMSAVDYVTHIIFTWIKHSWMPLYLWIKLTKSNIIRRFSCRKVERILNRLFSVWILWLHIILRYNFVMLFVFCHKWRENKTKQKKNVYTNKQNIIIMSVVRESIWFRHFERYIVQMECSLFKRDWTELKWFICYHRKISSYKDLVSLRTISAHFIHFQFRIYYHTLSANET